MNPNMRRLTLASVGIRRMPDKPAKRAPALGRQERAVKHDQVIFGQLEVERVAIIEQMLSASRRAHRGRGDSTRT
jgi:hypothetical protein